MNGFDPEFHDLDHYIRVITDRIWEGRRIEDIALYYGDACAVETPSSVSIGTQPIMAGTRATLQAFPDRRLLAEDVIISGGAAGGFLSSHRIFSPMTHAGPGAFGPPTGRMVYARTVADCVCVGNRIVHEWLVRDQAAIARQIGRHERDVAQDWLNERGPWCKPSMPAAPGGYVSFLDADPHAVAYAAVLRALWSSELRLHSSHAADAIAALPGGVAAVGVPAIQTFWRSMTGALTDAHFTLEHRVANPRAGRATALAVRWRVQARHTGAGRYGQPTGRTVEVMGISHADVDARSGRVLREWHLIDDVALWMQVLDPQA